MKRLLFLSACARFQLDAPDLLTRHRWRSLVMLEAPPAALPLASELEVVGTDGFEIGIRTITGDEKGDGM